MDYMTTLLVGSDIQEGSPSPLYKLHWHWSLSTLDVLQVKEDGVYSRQEYFAILISVQIVVASSRHLCYYRPTKLPPFLNMSALLA